MKKTSIVVATLGLFSLFLLGSCNQNKDSSIVDSPNTEPTELTSFETLQKNLDSLVINDRDKIVSNIYLPKVFESTGTILWTSSNTSIVTREGYVTRPLMGDAQITLQATGTYGASVDRRFYDLTIKRIPETADERVKESMEYFTLLENDFIDRDVMVLPRITDLNKTYIEWETSNSSIIDLEGNVYRKNESQQVTLTGIFSEGEVSYRKEFQVNVGSKADDEPLEIKTSDSRILNQVNVKDSLELISACKKAKPGDAIVLEDGTYNDLPLSITTSGTQEHPIFIFAKNSGKVFITGESNISVIGDYVTIANLVFTNGNPSNDKGVVEFEGDHLRFTNNKIKKFELQGFDYKWVSLTGKYHEIDHNTFDSKSTGGALLTIWRNNLESQYHHIHDNSFMNYTDGGGANGYETIRIGTSTYSQSDSNVLIENNYFYNLCGEIEIISIKSGRTIVRNNTFESCMGLVSCRHGKNDLVTGNVFLCNDVVDSGGIRMYDGGHQIRNNYIEGVNTSSNTRAGIVIHTGVNEIGMTTVMNLQWVPYNVLVENNTIVNSRNSVLFGGKYSYASYDTVFRGNYIVAKDYGAIRFDKEPTNLICTDNEVHSIKYQEDLSVVKDVQVYSGMNFSTNIPTLVKNSQGLYLNANKGAQNLSVNSSRNCGVLFS